MTVNWEMIAVAAIGLGAVVWAGRASYRSVTSRNKAKICSGDCGCAGPKPVQTLTDLNDSDEP